MAGRDGIVDAERAAAAETASPTTVPGKQSAGAAANGPVPGQTWARYVVLEALGAGGMGAVWAAYDTELERKVALKVLHDELLGRASQERLRREAKAMARVAHPNVVPVFDVGEHAGRSYYTMELVRGETVKDWARAGRAWREVARVYVEAARGLAAIHAAGLVHRDVKPGNLLLGDDGRARIADLGIAMSAPAAAPAGDEPSAGEELDAPIVATTTLRHAGTPAYMAPEQLRGETGDAASDQFSFGVALWESLHGRPPFDGGDVAARRAAIARGPTVARAARAVPGWLDAAARRALAVDPAARFPDVAALARALEGPRARRWPWLAAGGAVLAAVAIAIAVVASTRSSAPPAQVVDACATAGAELDDAWTPARKAAIEGAGGADPAASQRARTLAGALDRAVGDWRTSARTACQRTARHAWSDDLGARASWCLSRRANDLRDAIGDPGDAGRDDAIALLVAPRRCLDPAFLSAHVEPPADPLTATLVDDAMLRLHVAAFARSGGDPALADQLTDSTRALAARVRYAPLSAFVADLRTEGAEARGDFRGAEALEEDSYYASRAAGDDPDAQDAATAIVQLAASSLGDPALVDRWLKITRADAARRPDTSEAAIAYSVISQVEVGRGDAQDAVDDARRAVELSRTTFGETSRTYATVLGALASALDVSGRPAEAVPYYERALGLLTEWYGDGSPELAGVLQNAGLAQAELGHRAQAIELARAAVRATGNQRPPSAADLGEADLNLGVVLVQSDRAADAIPVLEDAGRRLASALPAGHADVALAHTNLAFARARIARDPQALRAALALERTAADETRAANGEDHGETAAAEENVADTLEKLGRCDDAEPLAQAALATFERAHNGVSSASPLQLLGACALRRGRPADAIPLFERAAAGRASSDPWLRADVQQALAGAYLATHDDAHAAAAERARRTDLDEAGADASVLAAVDRWLAAPQGPPP